MQGKYLVTKNIIYNFGGQITLLLLGLITTPFIIRSLGNELYGILSLVYVVVGYLSLLDLGLGLSIIKYISEYEAKSDKKTLEKLIGTSLTIYLIIGLCGAGLIFAATNLLVSKFLQIPQEVIPTAITVFYISGLGFFVNMVLTIFNAIPNALQRMDISNSRNILFGLLNTIGTVVLLALNQGIVEVVVWNIFVSMLATVVFIGVVRKLLPGISFSLKFDKAIFWKLLHFSGYKLVSNIGGQVVFQLDKLLIGFFYPIALVSFYVVPNLLVQKGFSFMLNITNAIFPAMSQSLSMNDNERVKNLYLRMTKTIVLTIFPVMALLFIFSESILFFWVGQEYADKGSFVLKILSVAYFIAAMSAPGVVTADAAGKPYLPAVFASISALINLIAAFILIPKLGIEGAAWAQLINFAAQVPVFLTLVHLKIVKISNLEVLLKSVIKPLTAGIFASLAVILLNQFFVINLLTLMSGVIIFCFVYLALNYLLGTFDDMDKKAIMYVINKISDLCCKTIIVIPMKMGIYTNKKHGFPHSRE